MEIPAPQRSGERVLVVDAEAAVLHVIGGLFSDYYRVSSASQVNGAIAVCSTRTPDVVVFGPSVRPSQILKFVEKTKPHEAEVALYAILHPSSDAPAIEDQMTGIFPLSTLQSESARINLVLDVDRAIQRRRLERATALQARKRARRGAKLLVGNSSVARTLRDEVTAAASSQLTLLITGETGVGKTLVAESVHQAQEGERRPFVVVEPAVVPPTLFESELFGHVKGAFTGAETSQLGAFEAAQGGTLFLDEVGELPISLQAKLLRAVEGKVIRRVGGTRDIHLEVRIIAATNRDIEADVNNGRFRADLYQRLNEQRLHIPPLRSRTEDIVPLLEHFFRESSLETDAALELTPAAGQMLVEYAWPGNVRELRTVARRLASLPNPGVIGEEILLPLIPVRLERSDGTLSPEERIRAFSRRVYLNEIRQHQYRLRDAARQLDMPYSTLRSRLAKLGLLDLVKKHKSGRDDDQTD